MKKFLIIFSLLIFLFIVDIQRSLAEINIDYSNISEITYKISTKDINDNIFIENNKQTNTLTKNGIVYIKVYSENTEDKTFTYPLKKNKFKKNLKSNKYIDKNDQRIKTSSEKISKDCKDILCVVKNAQNWTELNLQNSDSTTIRTTKEILDSKNANNTEKLLIISSLLKASNIPNKIVIGINYNIEDGSMKPNNWLSVYTGDWVDVDPRSNNLNLFTANNIRVYETFLDNDTDLAYFDNINKLIPNMTVSILNTKSNLQISIDRFNNPITSDVSEINLLKYIRGDSTSQLGEINVEIDNSGNFINIKTRNDLRQEEIIKEGFRAFVAGDVDKASKDFEAASTQFPINNDYLNVDYSVILAKIGMFELSQQRLSNISDYQIWGKRIEKIYLTYYPKTVPSKDQEINFSKAISLTNFPKNYSSNITIENILPYKENKSYDYANYLYAKYYYKKNDPKQAYKYIQKALRIYPKNYEYQLLKAQIQNSKAKYSQAAKIADKLSQENLHDKKLEETVKLLKYTALANKSKKTNERNFYLANYYFEKSDLQKAKELLEKNITSYPKDSENYLLLGRINILQEDYKKAEQNIKTALKLNPDDETTLLAYGDINLLLKNRQQAYDSYTKVLKKNKKSKDALKRIAAYYEFLSNQNCINYYKQVLEYYPDDVKSLTKLAYSYYLSGNTEKASDLYKQALSYNQNYLPAWFGLSKIAIDSKNSYIAREYLIPVYYINKLNPEYYYYSGLIDNIDKNTDSAKENFKKALELDPSNIRALLELKKLN